VISSASRGKTYLVPFLPNGKLLEIILQSRLSAILSKYLPPEVGWPAFQQLLFKMVGNPADFGALPVLETPGRNFLNFALSQRYLEFCQAKKIIPKGPIKKNHKKHSHFSRWYRRKCWCHYHSIRLCTIIPLVEWGHQKICRTRP